MAATKYGMRYSSIRYWQRSAIEHVRYNGDAGVFQRALQRSLGYPASTAQTVGHAAIQAAAVCHASAVKVAIQGK